MNGLQGKTALVTGASQGIGRACALVLARHGVKIAAAARNQAKLDEVVAEIRAAGGTADAFVLDVASEESIKSTAKAVIAHFGSVDILVNNAGITKDGLLLRMRRPDWDDVLATNLTGAFLLSQAVISSMMKSRWGRIINISSKAGLIGFSKSLAKEIASRNITVNVVAPGLIETAMTAVLDEKQREAMMHAIPLGRAGSDMDVAYAVAFLASNGASYITGHVLDVNGGMYMS
jgi:3-oxoacyl-[acyl-carrier protein] reductase